ncbi:MAG: hypothetical protein HC899_36580 [Leptolyngbyaceae cyanobacterium SM1_4_3]|nr:hypothetical protein [Leptolyngbyaceae cyanobacterium SM1_4_3]
MLDCIRRVYPVGVGHAIFSLFQIVTVRAECDAGLIEIGHGIIIGIVLNPDVGLIPGWWYHISFWN